MTVKSKRPTTFGAFTIAFTTVVNGCTASGSAFTPSVFETAKLACGAEDAYISESNPKAIGFRGYAASHAEQAKCLVERLKGTDAKVIGFISEPPS